MKPCATHRKFITWLALDALDVEEVRDLRAHLETCEACRRYLEAISNVTEILIAAESEPDTQTSESFHQRLVARLRAKTSASFLQAALSRLRAGLLNWRVALPAIGATAVLFAAFSVFAPRPAVPSPGPIDAQAMIAPRARSDLDPTISNYQRVANRSLEELDELLTRQGNRNPPPTTPLYTVATLPRANGLD